VAGAGGTGGEEVSAYAESTSAPPVDVFSPPPPEEPEEEEGATPKLSNVVSRVKAGRKEVIGVRLFSVERLDLSSGRGGSSSRVQKCIEKRRNRRLS